MARGAKGFSTEEKEELRRKLSIECEKRWATFGYKKTNIGELTSNIGISTGAFYLLYSSKEELFFETFTRVQNRLENKIKEILKKDKGKKGFIKALEWHFEEYYNYPFLYNVESSDFLSLLNKLPREKIDKLKVDSSNSFSNMIKIADLELKIDEEKANAVISTLLYTVTQKEQFTYNKKEIFSFIVQSVIDDIFV